MNWGLGHHLRRGMALVVGLVMLVPLGFTAAPPSGDGAAALPEPEADGTTDLECWHPRADELFDDADRFGATRSRACLGPAGRPRAGTPAGAGEAESATASGDADEDTANEAVGRWNEVPQPAPPRRYNPGAAYDASNGNTVMFGGSGLGYFGDTWVWNGDRWDQRRPAVRPASREGASMVYDAARGNVVLFGGLGFPDIDPATWIWDGEEWTELHPPTSPPARAFAMMAYDPASENVVLFGGYCEPGPCAGPTADSYIGNDTWTWDGETWTQEQPGSAPSARWFASMAADPRGGVVLFSGETYNDDEGWGLPEDTWRWDGTDWIRESADPGPLARVAHRLVYDVDRQQTLMFGGIGCTLEEEPALLPIFADTVNYDCARMNDMWAWDGIGWTEQEVDEAPPTRESPAFVYDSVRKQTVLTAGCCFATPDSLTDTWTWDGAAWTNHPHDSWPEPRDWASMAYHAATDAIVLFGGRDNGGLLDDDTWTWDGDRWTKQHPDNAPSRRMAAPMAYHAGTESVVLFGGWDLTTAGSLRPLRDTWTWDGDAWTQRSDLSAIVTAPPGGDITNPMVPDRNGDLMLFVRGRAPLPATWTWDGQSWTYRTPPTSPPYRTQAAMAYDPLREETVLFGGHGTEFDDTWVWDGETWTQRNPPTSPAARHSAIMGFDSGSGTIVLHGGSPRFCTSVCHYTDTWVWDGETWTEQHVEPTPGRNEGGSMAEWPATDSVLLFGGWGRNGYSSETWAWGRGPGGD